MSFETVFTATAVSHGGRRGHSETTDGSVKADLAMPKDGVLEPGKTTPEHLFAAGYAACFGGALEAVSKAKGVDARGAEVTIAVSFGKVEGGFGLAARITGKVPGKSAAEVLDLLEAAHKVCPYSKAVRGNIEVELAAA
ncbi:Ohr family peroxiredoxin [Xanthobacter sp. VTT E-85241]|uniref:Ohr family peroxiredoxin n=1 Tax=Roseixanthobacter finlandensis TaxID=3119922 RepID=UPI00372969D3